MPRGRRKSQQDSSSTDESHRPTHQRNLLEQISLLESFVKGSGASFSSSQLKDCLRESGYNVERALERLFSGAYQQQHTPATPQPSNNKDSSLSSVVDLTESPLVVSKTTSSSRSASPSTKVKKEARTAVSTSSAASGSRKDVRHAVDEEQTRRDSRTQNAVSTESINPARNRSSTASLEPQNSAPNLVTPRQPTSGGRPCTTAKKPPPQSSASHSTKESSSRNTTNAAEPSTNDGSNRTSAAPSNRRRPRPQSSFPPISQTSWLLCHRWLSDAIVTTPSRAQQSTRVAHQQVLELQPSASGAPVLRFRGPHIQGRLSDSLAQFLVPLCRYHHQQQLDDKSSKNSKDKKSRKSLLSSMNPIGRPYCEPLIRLHCQALMSEERLPSGAHIPVALSVYIEDVRTFFQLLDVHTSVEDSSPTPHWFHKQKKLRAHPAKGGAAVSTTNNTQGYPHNPWAQAAYNLLHWAEWGDVPEFRPPTPPMRNTSKSASKSKAPSPASKRRTPTKDKSHTEEQGDNDDVEDEATGAPSMDGEEWNEDDFEAASVSTPLTAEAKHISDSLHASVAAAMARLPEAPDPPGLTTGICLRPYQRQALYWMIQREGRMEGDDDGDQCKQMLREQMNLLSELAHESPSGRQPPSETRLPDGSPKEVLCECGPVLVTRAAQEESSTLDGVISPPTHPLWKTRFLQAASTSSLRGNQDEEVNEENPRTLSFYVNELLGVATPRPPTPPTFCSGGILADAMGLGKTVMLMSLILQSKTEMKPDYNGPRTTLVVAKLSLLPQWQDELQSKTNLSYLVYYGTKTMGVEQLQGVDVVITTYGTVQGAIRRKNSPLTQMKWWRVILDEAHCIRNQQTLASKVCCSLDACHRWCVSGTIIQNSLDDVYGIMKFLHHEPWCLPGFWKTTISNPLAKTNTASTGTSNSNSVDDPLDNDEERTETLHRVVDRVRRMLAPIMLRRTKDSLTHDGKPILTLPPVETKVITVHLTESEREFYNAVMARSLELFEGYVDRGTVAKSYIQILSLISRLRQVCDHISLTVRNRVDDEDTSDLQEEGRKPAAKKESNKKAPLEEAVKATPEDPNELMGSRFMDDLLSKFCSHTSNSIKRTLEPSTSSEAASSSPNKRPKQEPSFVSSVAASLSTVIRENSTHMPEECPICLDNPRIEDAVLTPCAHSFCRDCLVKFLRENNKKEATKSPNHPNDFTCPDGICPCCNTPIESKKIIALAKSDREGEAFTSKFLVGGYDNSNMTTPSKASSGPISAFAVKTPGSGRKIKTESPMSIQDQRGVRDTLEGNPSASARLILEEAIQGNPSSKMTAVLDELDNIWRQDPASKIIIFSQFLGFLDLMEMQFRDSGIAYYRLDGKLSLNKRMGVLEQFRSSSRANLTNSSSPSPLKIRSEVRRGTVLLMSMAAGAEGLNLVAASSVFIVDPWWNQSREDQCVNRIHRIGQLAEMVRVRKFVVENSVEERIVELQARKKYVAEEVYNDNGVRGADMGNMARLSLEDFRLIFKS